MAALPTVFVLEDDRVVAEGIAKLVGTVGLPARIFTTPREALDHIDRDSAGCVVLDLRLPGMSGLDVQAKLKANSISLPVVFVSAFADVRSVVQAMRNGAVDFLEKPFSSQSLVDAVQRAIQINEAALERRLRERELEAKLSTLTRRETEVLDLVCQGLTNRAIGEVLGISHKTVEVHRASLMDKLSAKSSAELFRISMEAHRMESPEPAVAMS